MDFGQQVARQRHHLRIGRGNRADQPVRAEDQPPGARATSSTKGGCGGVQSAPASVTSPEILQCSPGTAASA